MEAHQKKLIKQLRESSKDSFNKIIAAFSIERPNVFKKNKEKLNEALKMLGKKELIGKTLFDEHVHARHFQKINKEFSKEFKKLKNKDSIRFVTIIHAVTRIDDDHGIVEAIEIKDILNNVINRKEFSFIGAIEGEVINIEKMKIFAKENQDKETKKLDLCEKLIKNNFLIKDSGSILFLIHVHGILFDKTNKGFDDISEILRNIWSNDYQVELKKLYMKNTTEKNFRNIAKYITKGGQEWHNETSTLKYKIGFTSEDIETAWSLSTKQREDEGNPTEDTQALNPSEIVALASFVDKLMQLNDNETGYLIAIK